MMGNLFRICVLLAYSIILLPIFVKTEAMHCFNCVEDVKHKEPFSICHKPKTEDCPSGNVTELMAELGPGEEKEGEGGKKKEAICMDFRITDCAKDEKDPTERVDHWQRSCGHIPEGYNKTRYCEGTMAKYAKTYDCKGTDTYCLICDGDFCNNNDFMSSSTSPPATTKPSPHTTTTTRRHTRLITTAAPTNKTTKKKAKSEAVKGKPTTGIKMFTLIIYFLLN